eukprot:2685158-Rhodomonas_salina.2
MDDVVMPAMNLKYPRAKYRQAAPGSKRKKKRRKKEPVKQQGFENRALKRTGLCKQLVETRALTRPC